VALNRPVGVDLVLNLQVTTVVFSNVNCSLEMGRIRQSVVGTRFQSNRESLEAFCTISCVVGNFETVGCVVRELV